MANSLMALIRELWSYRGFILSSVNKEFQIKYSRSIFGFAWNIINPLAMVVVYTVVFSQVMRARLPGVGGNFAYSIFLCGGTLAWGLFAEITGRSQTMFIDNANLIKKLRFPRVCLPALVVSSALLNFFIIFSIFTLFLMVVGAFPGLVYLSLLPVVSLLVAFSTGLGMILGVLNVFFRDVGQAYGILLTFWFWFTPIVYPPKILPAWTHPFTALNPLASLIKAVQDVLVIGAWPNWISLLYPLLLSFLLCAFGLRLFRRHSGEMVDEL